MRLVLPLETRDAFIVKNTENHSQRIHKTNFFLDHVDKKNHATSKPNLTSFLINFRSFVCVCQFAPLFIGWGGGGLV